MKKIKIAIIGIGRMGSLHAKTVYNNPNCELVGFMDTDPVKMLAALAHYPTTCEFQTFDYMEQCCDAVIVATPASTHYEILKSLLPYKMNVLCEKPIVNDFDSFIHVAQRYFNEKKICYIGHTERFNPIIQQLIGRASDMRYPYNLKFVRKSNNKRNTDVSAIFDTMIHDIDLFMFLFRNTGTLHNIVVKDVAVDENLQISKCTAYIKFAKCNVCFQVDKSYQKEPKRVLYVGNMDESFKCCFKTSTISFLSGSSTNITNSLDPLTRQLNAFLDRLMSIDSSRYSCSINSSQALQSITLADKIEREALKFLENERVYKG